MKSIKWRLVAVLAAVVVLTGVVAGVSFAADNQAGPTGMKAMCQGFIAKLAVNLGVDEDSLTTAIEKTRRDMIDEAVQAGAITREKADEMIEKSADGACAGFGFPGGWGGSGDRFPGRDLDQLADVLGMSKDELKAEMDAGKKLDEIAGAQGRTVEQVMEKIKEARQAKIAQATAEGKTTGNGQAKCSEKWEQRMAGHCPSGR